MKTLRDIVDEFLSGQINAETFHHTYMEAYEKAGVETGVFNVPEIVGSIYLAADCYCPKEFRAHGMTPGFDYDDEQLFRVIQIFTDAESVDDAYRNLEAAFLK